MLEPVVLLITLHLMIIFILMILNVVTNLDNINRVRTSQEKDRVNQHGVKLLNLCIRYEAKISSLA